MGPSCSISPRKPFVDLPVGAADHHAEPEEQNEDQQDDEWAVAQKEEVLIVRVEHVG